MKFGIFILPSWPEAETSHQGRIYQEAVEQIQYAEELGFDAVWLAEHHFTRFGIISSAIPFATYVAAHTKTIRIGTGVSVLTFHNPIFMAEETAMLDVLSNGRLDFGVGRGQVVYEYNNFKVEYDSRTQRFQEIVDIILGLWSTPGFTYHGQYYSVDDMTIAPVPVQQPPTHSDSKRRKPAQLKAGELPIDVQVKVEQIRRKVDVLLSYADRFPPFSQDLYLVRQTAPDYLPGTLNNFMSMPPDAVDRPLSPGGKTARQELQSQLDLLDSKLDEIAQDLQRQDADRLLANRRFLESRFGEREKETIII